MPLAVSVAWDVLHVVGRKTTQMMHEVRDAVLLRADERHLHRQTDYLQARLALCIELHLLQTGLIALLTKQIASGLDVAHIMVLQEDLDALVSLAFEYRYK